MLTRVWHGPDMADRFPIVSGLAIPMSAAGKGWDPALTWASTPLTIRGLLGYSVGGRGGRAGSMEACTAGLEPIMHLPIPLPTLMVSARDARSTGH